VHMAVNWWNNNPLFSSKPFKFGGTRPLTDPLRPGVLYVTPSPNIKHLDNMSDRPQVVAQTGFMQSPTGSMCIKFQVTYQEIMTEDMSAASWTHTMMHELGHVLGLPDWPVKGCLMSKLPATDLIDPQYQLCPSELNLLKAIYGGF